MSLQHLNIDLITEAELQRLATDGVAESKALEYKEALVLTTDDQKREFLSDITALGNTDGGDLLLGMKADKGVATELVGLKNFVPDDSLSRIENLMRDSIQPRLMGIQIRPLALQNGNHALLIRVPRSFAAPHMVRHQGVTRFCGRNSNGKYDLDVHELRSAFLASETLSERLKAFRIERINKLVSGSPAVKLSGEHLLVLHLLPVISARADTQIPTSALERVSSGDNAPRPIAASGWGPGFNFDGLLVSSSWGDRSHHGYVQVMRNGFIEAVESQTLEPREIRPSGETQMIIPSIAWEKRLIHGLHSYLKTLKALDLPPPYIASLSLLNVRGYMMWVGPRYWNDSARLVDRDHLLTNETLIESADAKAESVLRPLFDQIWNACGWPKSINYDESGDWREHR
jgi:hypothetical protein